MIIYKCDLCDVKRHASQMIAVCHGKVYRIAIHEYEKHVCLLCRNNIIKDDKEAGKC